MDWQDIVLNYINNEMIKSCWRFNWHKISGGIMMALDSDYGYSAEVELTYRFKSRLKKQSKELDDLKKAIDGILEMDG